jgi:hypothetical protein
MTLHVPFLARPSKSIRLAPALPPFEDQRTPDLWRVSWGIPSLEIESCSIIVVVSVDLDSTIVLALTLALALFVDTLLRLLRRPRAKQP